MSVKFTPMVGRYGWYDESIKGCGCGVDTVKFFEQNRLRGKKHPLCIEIRFLLDHERWEEAFDLIIAAQELKVIGKEYGDNLISEKILTNL